MKRYIALIALAILASALTVSAADIESVTLSDILAGIGRARAPVVAGKYVVFTAPGNARYTGIAFDFEEYRQTHPFKRIVRRDADGKPLENTLFYIAEIPPETSEINYRMVVDGLWTTDPLNPSKTYDYENGMTVSKVLVPRYEVFKTSAAPAGLVRFTWEGETGRHIALAGSFNGWDPFMYALEEREPGRYSLELPLPKGTWYYAYFEGTDQLPDLANDNRVYTKDGRVASVITVR